MCTYHSSSVYPLDFRQRSCHRQWVRAGESEVKLVLIFGQGYSQTIEIGASHEVRAVAFTANGECLVSGGFEGVQVWRVKDGEQVATVEVRDIWSVAVPKDGRFIAAGALWGDVFVWDATTCEQVFAGRIPDLPTIYAVDFSPDSTRVVSAWKCTATIWDIAADEEVCSLGHGQPVFTAKYSPQGNRIATAHPESVQVWDSDDQCLLVDVKAGLEPWRGLLWLGNNHLLIKTIDSKIRQIDASTGSTVSEWPVPYDHDSWIALPQHGQCIARSTKDKITFWDTSTHTQLGLIPRSSENGPIAFSPDDRLAIVSLEKKIIIKTLSFVKVCPVFFRCHPAREHLSLSHTQGAVHSY